MRKYQWLAIGLISLAGLLFILLVVEHCLKSLMPREKVAQIARGMSEAEVVALLGPPHGGLPRHLSPISPETYASSWEYDDGSLAVWFNRQTNLVEFVSVFGPGRLTLFEKVWYWLVTRY
jgi:hypothetical protein